MIARLRSMNAALARNGRPTPLDMRRTDARTCADLNMAAHSGERARFGTIVFGDPGATAAARWGVCGR